MENKLNENTQKAISKMWMTGLILFLIYISVMIIIEAVYSFTLDNSIFYIVCCFVFLFLFSLYLAVCYLQYTRELWVLFSLSTCVLAATLIGAIIHVVFVQDVTGSTMAIATAPLILSGIIFILGEKSIKQKPATKRKG